MDTDLCKTKNAAPYGAAPGDPECLPILGDPSASGWPHRWQWKHSSRLELVKGSDLELVDPNLTFDHG